MPIYNGSGTLMDVLKGLEFQEDKQMVEQIIFIDDNSSDGSTDIIIKYLTRSSYAAKLIRHEHNKGLAATYNEGINDAHSDLIILMHQDIFLEDPHSIEKITNPLTKGRIAASYPTLVLEDGTWRKYSFWEKCLFSRFVGKEVANLTGKFDCFRKEALMAVGEFDSHTYRTAGEDGDIKVKFDRNGFMTVPAGFHVAHIDSSEREFTARSYLKKEAQIAEAQGVLLRKYGPRSPGNFVAVFFREILLLALFIPYVQWVALLTAIIYSIAYTARVFKFERDMRLTILPLVNLAALPIALTFSLRGFLLARQTV
jgi:glycosyltransferase involved in cell wall biosynthesis